MQMGIHTCLSEGPTAGRPCRLGTTPSTLGVHHRIVQSARQGGKPWGPQSTCRILTTTTTARFPVCTKLSPILGSRMHAPPASPLRSLAHRTLVCSDRDTYLDPGFVHLSLLSPERSTCRLFSWNGAQGSWLSTARRDCRPLGWLAPTLQSPWPSASSWNPRMTEGPLKQPAIHKRLSGWCPTPRSLCYPHMDNRWTSTA
jgi:hypothetical protein